MFNECPCKWKVPLLATDLKCHRLYFSTCLWAMAECSCRCFHVEGVFLWFALSISIFRVLIKVFDRLWTDSGAEWEMRDYLLPFFCKSITNSTNTICWIFDFFQYVFLTPLWKKFCDHTHVCLLLDPLLCSICPHVCFCGSPILSSSLWLCSIIWGPETQCLQLCSLAWGLRQLFLWLDINFWAKYSNYVQSVVEIMRGLRWICRLLLTIQLFSQDWFCPSRSMGSSPSLSIFLNFCFQWLKFSLQRSSILLRTFRFITRCLEIFHWATVNGTFFLNYSPSS